MKKFLSALLITLFAFTSCKKENTEFPLNTNSLELIQKIISSGYWQVEYIYDVEESEKVAYDDYTVFNFINNNEIDNYHSKNEDPYKFYYRLENVNGVAEMKLYTGLEDFEENEGAEYYQVRIEDGFLVLFNENEEIFFKKFNSLIETKEIIELEELN